MEITIKSAQELRHHRTLVVEAAKRTTRRIKSLRQRGVGLLAVIKFETVGHHPGNPATPLNVIEQVNQTFTYLVSFKAVEYLLRHKRHLAGGYRLRLGTTRGLDIESVRRNIVAAEVFATVDPKNNRKLAKDIAKVARTNARFKYVFYYCPSKIDPPRNENKKVRVIPLHDIGQRVRRRPCS
jgi:hypothetical protein